MCVMEGSNRELEFVRNLQIFEYASSLMDLLPHPNEVIYVDGLIAVNLYLNQGQWIQIPDCERRAL